MIIAPFRHLSMTKRALRSRLIKRGEQMTLEREELREELQEKLERYCRRVDLALDKITLESIREIEEKLRGTERSCGGRRPVHRVMPASLLGLGVASNPTARAIASQLVSVLLISVLCSGRWPDQKRATWMRAPSGDRLDDMTGPGPTASSALLKTLALRRRFSDATSIPAD
jgi:hypothetical protein